ncbi:hypothetical protein [Persicobacter psychrovividus]
MKKVMLFSLLATASIGCSNKKEIRPTENGLRTTNRQHPEDFYHFHLLSDSPFELNEVEPYVQTLQGRKLKNGFVDQLQENGQTIGLDVHVLKSKNNELDYAVVKYEGKIFACRHFKSLNDTTLLGHLHHLDALND